MVNVPTVTLLLDQTNIKTLKSSSCTIRLLYYVFLIKILSPPCLYSGRNGLYSYSMVFQSYLVICFQCYVLGDLV
jgi:hypothetical protein